MMLKRRLVKLLLFILEEVFERCNGFLFVLVFASIITFIVIKDTLSQPYDRTQHKDTYAAFDFKSKRDFPFVRGCVDPDIYSHDSEYIRQNATFVMLTKNDEFEEVKKTMNSLESHFNQWYNYPYVFLNNVDFTDEFKENIRNLTKAEVRFGTLDELLWEFPDGVRDSFEFHQRLVDQSDRSIMYGGMESYHKMCRFYSGLFYKHPLVQQHEWYWRIEPDVEFFCDLTYDPFFEMQKSNKKYGFAIIIPELYWTVANLFRYTRSFIRENDIVVGSLWKLFTRSYKVLDTEDEELQKWVNFEKEIDDKISEMIAIEHLIEFDTEDDDGIEFLIRRAQSKYPIIEDKFDDEEYNMCHFWSNFEIAKVEVFDNDLYNSYFEYLEKSGGFWKERWGDAPVHSLGLGIMLNLADVHYFRDIGYRHSKLHHCPRNWDGNNKRGKGQLPYEEKESRFARQEGSLKWNYDKTSEFGSGCRCICPKKMDVEDSSYQCFEKWIGMVFFDNEDDYNFELDGEWTGKVDTNKRYKAVKKDFLRYKKEEDDWVKKGIKVGEADDL